MYILKIIPIANGLPENYFSYFSKEKYFLGSLVEVKIRNRKIPGLVCEIVKVENEKISLKSQKFTLRKIEKVLKEKFIDENLFQSINETAFLLGVKESEIVKNYIPNFVFENIDFFSSEETQSEKKNLNKIITISDFQKRHELYLDKIRENLKNKKSTTIFFPTINDLEISQAYFEKNKIKNVAFFHSGQTKSKVQENLNKIKEGNVLVLSTSSLLPFLLKEKIGLNTIILEKENSYNYFSHTSKKQIDAREFIKKISEDLNLELLLGGNIISLQSFEKANLDAVPKTKEKNKFRIVDLTQEKELKKEELKNRVKKISKQENEEYNSVYFSGELVKKLEETKANKGKVFLYTKRKGLYTETICLDCNTIFKCKDCDKPYILFKKNDQKTERLYICANCKKKKTLSKSENLTCENCGSWRMKTLGVGTQGVEENLKEIGWKTFVLDSEIAKTKTDIKNILKNWQKEKTSILIGTDLALNFLNTNFETDLAAIISLDSLFSIPEINIDEKILNICLEMKEKINVKEKILIQTRLREQNVWEYLEDNNILDFLRDEIETRRNFDLPPYINILKFKIEKKNIKIKDDIERILEKIFIEEEVENKKVAWVVEKKTGAYVGTLSIPKKNWQIKKDGKNLPSSFTKKIVSLLSDFRLEINPQNIF